MLLTWGHPESAFVVAAALGKRCDERDAQPAKGPSLPFRTGQRWNLYWSFGFGNHDVIEIGTQGHEDFVGACRFLQEALGAEAHGLERRGNAAVCRQ